MKKETKKVFEGRANEPRVCGTLKCLREGPRALASLMTVDGNAVDA